MKLWISLISLTLGPVACWIGCLPIGLHRQALDHEAVNMPVDLAVGREYTGPFHQAFIPTHGKQFRLQIEPRFDTIEEALAALADFKATLVVRSEEGEILLNQQLTVQDFEEDTSPGCRWYATLDPTTPYAFLRHFSIDDKACTLTLSVKTPAPSLAGRE